MMILLSLTFLSLDLFQDHVVLVDHCLADDVSLLLVDLFLLQDDVAELLVAALDVQDDQLLLVDVLLVDEPVVPGLMCHSRWYSVKC